VTNPIIDLSAALAVHPRTRSFIHLLRVGEAIGDAFERVLPQLTQTEQRVLVTVIAWRLQGSLLPASITLLEHCPQLTGIDAEEIQRVVGGIVDCGILSVVARADGEAVDAAALPKSRVEDVEVYFAWPALEILVTKALDAANRPKIVGADGAPIR